MINSLSEEDFLKILLAAETIRGVVVGGQALNLWADALLNAEDFAALGPFTSKDIDFWGLKEDAEQLSVALNGKLLLPEDKFSNTVSSAAVQVVLSGVEHQIDFLRVVCGLDTEVMLSRAEEIVAHGKARTAVLHPLDVLKSRIAGINVLRRSDAGAVRQLKASPHIAYQFLLLLLNGKEIKAAQVFVTEMMQIGAGPDCDNLYAQYGFDVLDLVLKTASHPTWNPLFAKHQITDRANKLNADRNRRLTEAARKLQGKAS